ncbi:hypothetical protein AB0F18_12210, partial [Streptomyces sp. NPDC029216]
MTEYPTSQEGPQPTVAPGGGTDELGHGKAPIAAAEAVRTHADFPRPRGTADETGGQGGESVRVAGHDVADAGTDGARARDGEAARNAGRRTAAGPPRAGPGPGGQPVRPRRSPAPRPVDLAGVRCTGTV